MWIFSENDSHNEYDDEDDDSTDNVTLHESGTRANNIVEQFQFCVGRQRQRQQRGWRQYSYAMQQFRNRSKRFPGIMQLQEEIINMASRRQGNEWKWNCTSIIIIYYVCSMCSVYKLFVGVLGTILGCVRIVCLCVHLRVK